MLQVLDLERSQRWYETVLGVSCLARDPDGHGVTLGVGARPLIRLRQSAAPPPSSPGSRLGLFHVAILLPDRAALGRFLRHVVDHRIPIGASDHLVSEALYLQDPDGLGLEVYADRPRSTWQFGDGELLMATDPLDAAAVLAAAEGQRWDGAPAGTTIGHVHLHVGDLGEAGEFYDGVIGFDRVVTRYPGALFLSAGGYHHHLGTNTWARGATSPMPDEPQLLDWRIELPEDSDVERFRQHAAMRGVELADLADGVWIRDPWGTPVSIVTAPR